MTALPAGVTLEAYWPDRAQVQALRVVMNGAVVGSVWPTHMYGHAARGLDEGVTRTGFRTEDDAVRWVCLQARPVVYQVRQVRDSIGLVGWDVLRPGADTAVAMMGPTETSRQHAMNWAHVMAANPAPGDLEARA